MVAPAARRSPPTGVPSFSAASRSSAPRPNDCLSEVESRSRPKLWRSPLLRERQSRPGRDDRLGADDFRRRHAPDDRVPRYSNSLSLLCERHRGRDERRRRAEEFVGRDGAKGSPGGTIGEQTSGPSTTSASRAAWAARASTGGTTVDSDATAPRRSVGGCSSASRTAHGSPSGARPVRDQARYRQSGRVRARRDDGASHRGEAAAKPVGRNPPVASLPGRDRTQGGFALVRASFVRRRAFSLPYPAGLPIC